MFDRYRLKELREDRGLSYSDVELNSCYRISAYDLERWEEGYEEPSRDDLHELADVFYMSMDELYDELFPSYSSSGGVAGMVEGGAAAAAGIMALFGLFASMKQLGSAPVRSFLKDVWQNRKNR